MDIPKIKPYKITENTVEMLVASGLLETKTIVRNVGEDFLLGIIKTFLDIIGINTEKIHCNSQDDELLYPEIMECIDSNYSLQSAANAILKHLSNHEFDERDLLNITNKGFNKFLRHISNYLIYCTSKIQEFEKHSKAVKVSEEEMENMIKETKQYAIKTVNAIDQRDVLVKENELIKQKIQELEESMSHDEKELNDLHKALQGMREKNSEDEEKNRKIETEIEEVRQQLKKAEKKLVSSPNKIANDRMKLHKMKEEVEMELTNLNESLMKKTELAKEKNKKYEVFDDLVKKSEKCLQEKEKYCEAVEKLESAKKHLSELKKEIQNKEEVVSKSDSKKQERAKHLEMITNKHEKQMQILLKKKHDFNSKNAEVEANHQKLLQEKKSLDLKILRGKELLKKQNKENEDVVKEGEKVYLTVVSELIENSMDINKLLD